MEMALEKTEKKVGILSNLSSIAWIIITIVAIAVFFYATTVTTLSEHTNQIEEIKDDVGSIKTQMHDAAINQSVSAEEIKNLNEKINGVDSKVDKMDEKLDRILMQTK